MAYNLNLCLDHKQEWKQSHYAKENCDYCKLQKQLDTAMQAIYKNKERAQAQVAGFLKLFNHIRQTHPLDEETAAAVDALLASHAQPENPATIQLTVENVSALQKAYDQAVANNQESFTWEGRELLTAYARYLLEYANTVLPTRK